MVWNGGYGFKNSKKIKYRALREKTTPFPHTGWPWWPFNALFVLCRSPVSAATLANANLGQIRVNFARNWPNFRVRACASSPQLRALLRARLANCCTVTKPCPHMDLFVTSHPSARRLSSMVWLSTTTCTPRRPRRRLRPPLLRNMRLSLRWLPSMAKHENLAGKKVHVVDPQM